MGTPRAGHGQLPMTAASGRPGLRSSGPDGAPTTWQLRPASQLGRSGGGGLPTQASGSRAGSPIGPVGQQGRFFNRTGAITGPVRQQCPWRGPRPKDGICGSPTWSRW